MAARVHGHVLAPGLSPSRWVTPLLCGVSKGTLAERERRLRQGPGAWPHREAAGVAASCCPFLLPSLDVVMMEETT